MPPRANTLVPGESSVPYFLNQLAPLFIIAGILANVSTLFKQVGEFHRPRFEGIYVFILGSPRLPSIEFIRAVSSPHTKAPAPYFSSILKLKLDPSILLPNNPASSA